MENLLRTSDMRNSDFRYFLIPDYLRTSPRSENKLTGAVYVRKTYPYTREHAPSSTLNSSAKDLSKWMTSFLYSLSDSTSSSIYSAMMRPSFDLYPHIGLGFQLSELNSERTIGHYGGDRGFRSYLLMIPSKGIGLVMLANCDYNEDFRQEILHPIAKLMLSEQEE